MARLTRVPALAGIAVTMAMVKAVSPSPARAQTNEAVGSAIVQFLLGNPSTANKMNPGQRAALQAIGDLLTTEGQWQHELQYARAGRNEIVLQTNGGQAQLVRDEKGNVYLLVDGVIHPIASTLVSQAASLAGVTQEGLPEQNSVSAPDSTNLGLMYLRGEGVEKDLTRALDLLKVGCDAGDVRGCLNSGKYYGEVGNPAPYVVQALAFYRKACDLGSDEGCYDLGNEYIIGMQDYAQAKAVWKKACKNGFAMSCGR